LIEQPASTTAQLVKFFKERQKQRCGTVVRRRAEFSRRWEQSVINGVVSAQFWPANFSPVTARTSSINFCSHTRPGTVGYISGKYLMLKYLADFCVVIINIKLFFPLASKLNSHV